MPLTSGWQVWVDTGGTFTDCVARDPTGRQHRVKVLSSSALRGRIWPVTGARVRFGSDLSLPDGFFRSGVLRRMNGDHARVLASRGASGDLRLAEPMTSIEPGEWGEVAFAEEAPILAARLVTGTAAGEPLPELSPRLPTTRGIIATLERCGAPVSLFVPAGFGDVLSIGTR